MMKKLPILIALIALASMAWAQDTNVATQKFNLGVDEIATMSTSGNPADLILKAPAVGGEAPTPATDDGTYLRYTSVVQWIWPVPGGRMARRDITAKVSVGSVPTGTTLTLLADTPTGLNLGGAQVGSSSGTISLSGTAQQIMTSVKSCATGTGGADGARLHYNLSVTDWRTVRSSALSSITVLFTMTDGT